MMKGREKKAAAAEGSLTAAAEGSLTARATSVKEAKVPIEVGRVVARKAATATA